MRFVPCGIAIFKIRNANECNSKFEIRNLNIKAAANIKAASVVNKVQPRCHAACGYGDLASLA